MMRQMILALGMALLAGPAAARCQLDITVQNNTGHDFRLYQDFSLNQYNARVRVRGGGWKRIWGTHWPNAHREIRDRRSYRFNYSADLDCNKLRQFRFGYICLGTDSGPLNKYFPDASSYYRRGSTRFHFALTPADCTA